MSATPSDLVEQIYAHVQAGEVDNSVVACLRLAKQVRDPVNVVQFLRELYPDRDQLGRAVFDETQHLNEEARAYIWKSTAEQWIEERTINTELKSNLGADPQVLALGVGELRREVEQMERSIDDLQLPASMGEFDAAAFTDRHIDFKGRARLKIRACHTVLERVRTRCLQYATRVESQLLAQENTKNLISTIQQNVDSYYSGRSEAVYQALARSVQLAASAQSEDHSLSLVAVRRVLKAVADHHYPAVLSPIVCQDGKSRILGEEQYLNRLEEFCRCTFGQGKSGDLAKAELDLLAAFIRRINDIASKGTHAAVTSVEARQGALGTYMFLSNLISAIQDASPASRESPARGSGL